jgi:hypothetical protein
MVGSSQAGIRACARKVNVGRTFADYQTTKGIIKLIENSCFERNFLIEEIEAAKIAGEILKRPPTLVRLWPWNGGKA